MKADLSRFLVAIPSYCPPSTLPQFVCQLKQIGFTRILIINDGSPPRYDHVFARAMDVGALVISYPENQGKGGAIKKGVEYALNEVRDFDYFLNCDDDGQHDPYDVLLVAQSVRDGARFYLGSRSFKGKVPMNSFIGNIFMQNLFWIFTGKKIQDTQTGLRCYQRDLLPELLETPESGFDHETASLLRVIKSKEPFIEVPIRTIYINENKSTRFRFIKDSARVVLSLFFHR